MSCDLVKFTTGYGMDYATSYTSSSGGGGGDGRYFSFTDMDSGGILRAAGTDVSTFKTENLFLKSMMVCKSEKDETKMETLQDDERSIDTKTSPSVPALQSTSEAEASTELKSDSDKLVAGTGDAVATSNVSTTSAAAEMSSVMSASDLKKEAQAISYDWVSLC